MSEVVVAELTPSRPWFAWFAELGRAQKLRLALGAVMVGALVVIALIMGRQPDWKVLYANLADKDGGAIIAQLAQMNVPYKYTEGGGAIMVPSERVHDIRLRLASQGLPKGGTGGFEAMDTGRFGMTQFQERLSFQRGLEGELVRSIQSLGSVQSARVHLALPNQNGFFREQQKPSASVLLTLHGGRSLDRNQIAGIVHLVAASVPEMQANAVSVIDDTGKLLSQSPESSQGVVDAQQLQYVQQVEQSYQRRIIEILEPIVGRDNVKAQVTADIDFSQTELTSETHKPNQGGEPATVRSQQTSEAGPGVAGNNGMPLPGVPGATSNQPPAASSAPVNGATPTLTVNGGNSGAGVGANGKRESVVNYEVDKTVRVVKAATGGVRRVTAAVVVNFRTSTDAQGKASSKPLSEDQINQMTALVKETIGFNKDRGDSVNMMNTAFANDKPAVEDVPLWRQAEVLDAARSFAWPLAMVVLAILVIMGLIRPAMRSVAVQKNADGTPVVSAGANPLALPGKQLDAIVDGDPDRPGLESGAPELARLPAAPEHLRLEDARMLVRQNPIAVANIVKSWVNGEPAT